MITAIIIYLIICACCRKMVAKYIDKLLEKEINPFLYLQILGNKWACNFHMVGRGFFILLTSLFFPIGMVVYLPFVVAKRLKSSHA